MTAGRSNHRHLSGQPRAAIRSEWSTTGRHARRGSLRLATCLAAALLAGSLVANPATANSKAKKAETANPQTTDPDDHIPDLIGTWRGENRTISDLKGLRSWTKTVHITDQTDRRFRGYFTYSAGTKHFFGIIFPDNQTVRWVASDSRGSNQARLLSADRLAACYIESGIDATAGCATLDRISKTPPPAPPLAPTPPAR